MDERDREIRDLRERVARLEGEQRALLDELAQEREAARLARQASGRQTGYVAAA